MTTLTELFNRVETVEEKNQKLIKEIKEKNIKVIELEEKKEKALNDILVSITEIKKTIKRNSNTPYSNIKCYEYYTSLINNKIEYLKELEDYITILTEI